MMIEPETIFRAVPGVFAGTRRRERFALPVVFQHEEIFITSYKDVGFCSHCEGKKIVIVGISANRLDFRGIE